MYNQSELKVKAKGLLACPIISAKINFYTSYPLAVAIYNSDQIH